MSNDQILNDCGCCEGTSAETPARLENRPGLDEIAYRVGTHAQFKESMLARLSSADLPALDRLQTRDDDDFSIALLDGWATVADVLAFYQERLANEAFLRTARQRRSILELARLIGYQLRPGVAASTYLAFTLDEPPPIAAPGTLGGATIAQTPDRIFIEPGVQVQSVPGPDEKPQTFETVERIEARPAWNAIRPRLTVPQALDRRMTEIWLQGTNLNIETGDVLIIATSTGLGAKRIETVDPDQEADRTKVTLAEAFSVKEITDEREVREQGLWIFRVRASPFGHNAPQKTVVRTREDDGTTTTETSPMEWRLDEQKPKQLSLDAVYDEIQVDSSILISYFEGITPHLRILTIKQIMTRSEAKYGITGRVTRLKLNTDWLLFPERDTLALLRVMTIYAQSEKLTQAEMPLSQFEWGRTIRGKAIDLPAGGHGLKPGQTIVVSGKIKPEEEEPTSEIAVIERVETVTFNEKTYDNLVLERDLQHEYIRETVTINANVARATHGESVAEIMGSGDGAQPGQRFLLRQPPLTHVSAAMPSGAQTTLEVRVNDLLWQQVPSLFGRGPDEHVYVTRLDDDGTTAVQFGDGRRGARLPTGAENVSAAYRKGIGVEGLVKARQLSLLMTRPLGVTEVINPAPAEGAEDPESRDQARGNAPLTVLTLDRIVSLQDFEDFSLAFGGVAKALATWSWQGERRSVVVTVAGPEDRDGRHTVGQKVLANLHDALRNSGDPFVPFRVVPYRPQSFVIAARIKVDPAHSAEQVLASVESSLRERFSFDRRQFAQPVARSEVIAAAAQVAGVLAVDLDRFHRGDAEDDMVVITEELFAAILEAGTEAGLKEIQFCAPSETPPTIERRLLETSLQAMGIEGVSLEIILGQALGVPSRLDAQPPTVDDTGTLLGAELLTLDDGPLQLGLMT